MISAFALAAAVAVSTPPVQIDSGSVTIAYLLPKPPCGSRPAATAPSCQRWRLISTRWPPANLQGVEWTSPPRTISLLGAVQSGESINLIEYPYCDTQGAGAMDPCLNWQIDPTPFSLPSRENMPGDKFTHWYTPPDRVQAAAASCKVLDRDCALRVTAAILEECPLGQDPTNQFQCWTAMGGVWNRKPWLKAYEPYIRMAMEPVQ